MNIPLTKDKEIAKSLYAMSIRRQATLSEDALSLYVEDLKSYPLPDVQDACRAIGSAVRGAGEKALPEIGLIIEEVKRMGKLRHDPDKKCRHCMNGLQWVLDGKGASYAVKPCVVCGGPGWYQDSLKHNHALPVRG